MTKSYYYFDYAAATPLSKEAAGAMQPYLTSKFYNPSALYLAAQDNKHDLEKFRSIIAQGLGAKSSEVIFTAGGSEANNLAVQGILRQFDGGNIVISNIEHASVLQPASLFNCKLAKVDNMGVIDIKNLENLIDAHTVLVSVIYANNEIGSIQPIKDIARIVKKVNTERQRLNNTLPLYLHTDACQAANYLDMQVSKLGVDLMTLNAGKIYGPKQCGALFVKTGVRLQPLVLGGGQEKDLRSGTENLANIAGFAVAWQQTRADYRQESKRLTELRDSFIKQIQLKNPHIQINGSLGPKRLANNINLTIRGVDNETLVMMLDEAGFMVATGSACHASSNQASWVLGSIGVAKKDANSSIRITLGRQTTAEDLKKLANKLTELIDSLAKP